MIRTIGRRLLGKKKRPVVRLDPVGRRRGVFSLSYIAWPFRDGWDSPKARGHTNAFECVAIAEAFRSCGLAVEVVDHDDADYVPPADCIVAMDIHSNLERWDPFLPAGCIRLLHATGPHWLGWNHGELARLVAVRDRKGIALAPRRQVSPSRGVEVASRVTVLGNQYTIDSFGFAGKPVTRVPISSAYRFEWPSGRNLEDARRRFLWVGSYGMVHKGLDLALDAFAGMPDLELTVCGRPEKERDFFRLYEKELRHTPNIRFHGWIDMGAPDFLEIARTHSAIVYPSSAEGGAGSVIHAMHAGMAPIVTTEASIDCGSFGSPIAAGDVASVQAAVRRYAELPAPEVEARARGAYEHVRAHHTQELFRENINALARQIVGSL